MMKHPMLVYLLILCLLPLGGGAEGEETLYPIREGGLWGYMNRAGETVIEPQWDDADLFENGYAEVSNIMVDQETGHYDEKVSLIDREGRAVLDPGWERLRGDVIFDPETEKYGFFDRKSGFLQEPKYDLVLGYDGIDAEFRVAAQFDGTAEERDPDGWYDDSGLNYGALRKSDGEAVIPFVYTGGGYDEVGASEGYILLANEIHGLYSDTDYGPEYHLFDGDGNEIRFPDGLEPWSRPREGVLTVKRKLDESEMKQHPFGWGEVFGLARPDGTVIVEPCYDYVFEARDGMVCFYQDGLNGWMDLSGAVKVPPVYDLSSGGPLPQAYYENGYLVIQDEDARRCVLLDREGRELYSVPEEENGIYRDFGWVYGNQRFWLCITEKGKTRYQLMKIGDGRVEPVTEPVFDRAEYVCSPDSVFWMNETELSDEPMPAGMDGKCGFIDRDGNAVIPFAYDAVMYFYHGLALAEKDGKLLYLDERGNTVWQEK